MVATRWQGISPSFPLLLAFRTDCRHTSLVNAHNKQAPDCDAHFQAILAAAVEAIVIIDHSCLIRAFSTAAENLFGYAKEEVLGQNVNILMPEPFRSGHDSWVARHLATGEKHIIGTGREVSARRKDGSVFPVYLSVGEGQSAEGGFFVGILHDLTREKAAFRRVQQLAAIVDSTADAVLGKTLDGVVTYWNRGAEELYGYTAEEAIGRHVSELIVPLDKLEELDSIAARIRQGENVARETERHDKSGKRLIVSLTISPILDADGNVTGASAISRDITARRMAERAQADARRAAEESNRVKSDFLSIVSHELRTPLTIILGNISLLTDHEHMPDPAEAAGIAQDIEDSANRLLALINDLLDISDMEAGEARLRLAPMQAEELVLEVAQAADVMAAPKGLEVEFYTEPLALMADPLRLKQALINLVDNAVKFTQSGTITVGVSRAGESALFEVRDTGPGIPEVETGRIFDAFHQADTSSTRTAQGTGLGLTIVRRIVELHGGVLSVESEPGKGSTFFIAIPLNEDANDLHD